MSRDGGGVGISGGVGGFTGTSVEDNIVNKICCVKISEDYKSLTSDQFNIYFLMNVRPNRVSI